MNVNTDRNGDSNTHQTCSMRVGSPEPSMPISTITPIIV